MKRQLQVAGCGLLVAGAVAVAQIQMQDAPVKAKSYVIYVAESQMVAAGKPGALVVKFHVLDGYHVNSHRPKSELLLPTGLTLDAADGVKAGTVEYPAGKAFRFRFDPGETLDVYAGDFALKLPVVAAAGEHTVAGTLKYQACDDRACYPPKTLAVQVPFTAK